MDAIGLLRKLVSIDSVFPNEREIGEFAEAGLRESGFSVHRQELSPGRFNVLAERGSEGKPVILYAHLDSVPVYGKWETDPFSLTEKGDRLYGLGSYDIKSGVAAILKACEQGKENGRRVKVAFCADEENDSAGANRLCNSENNPDSGFVRDSVGVIATEILDVPDASSNCVMLGRRGRCVLQIDVPGKSAHGGHAGEGVNAISEAARLVTHLDGMALPESPPFPKPNQFIRKIAAENTSLSLPDSALVELDRHLVGNETPESARAHVQAFVDSLYAKGEFREISGRRMGVKVKQRAVPYMLPYATPKESEIAKIASDAVRSALGEPRYVYGATVADENMFAMAGLPVVTLGPVGGNQHTANEWVSKKSYLELVRTLALIVQG